MATIRKKNGKWKVEIRKSGYPNIYRTFFEHKTALKYAKDIKTQMDKNIFEDYSGASGTTLKVLLIKYRNEITTNKKGVAEKPKNVRDPSFKKKPTSPVEIDWNLPPMHTAGLWSNIKNSSIYKLLDNPQVLGTELGHETIIEIINLLQNSGLLKDGGIAKK